MFVKTLLCRLPNNKQSFRGVLRKRYSENMQQIYRRNHTLAWVFRKFAAYFQNTFSYEHQWRTASETNTCKSLVTTDKNMFIAYF